MTCWVPLDSSAGTVPTSPSFLQVSANPTLQLQKAIKAILKAKRIVIVCGAGISVKAGIPDFRSPEGLFQTLKRDNPKEVLASGKDLFDASVFHSENTTSLFYQMIARLSELSNAAEPTPFHNLLRALDDRGKLLRVYSQNIDSLEQKCGLSFGVPEFQERRSRPRTPKSKSKTPSSTALTTTEAEPIAAEPIASTSRLPTPPPEIPRCIPLHGTLQTVHCQICNHSYALADHLAALELGTPPACPECTAMEETRQLVGKRARGVGRLRPSVVLYNEAHKDGEGVGDVVRRDLLGLSNSKGKGRSAGADLLLVVGTSLRVQGTKRMVREFAKAVRASAAGSNRPSPSPAGPGATEEEREPPVKTVYLNLDFPVPTREWEGVFDAWLQGDAQVFAEMLQVEIDKEAQAKQAASEKRRRKEKGEDSDGPEGAGGGKKRKSAKAESKESPTKKRKITISSGPLPPDPTAQQTDAGVVSIPPEEALPHHPSSPPAHPRGLYHHCPAVLALCPAAAYAGEHTPPPRIHAAGPGWARKSEIKIDDRAEEPDCHPYFHAWPRACARGGCPPHFSRFRGGPLAPRPRARSPIWTADFTLELAFARVGCVIGLG
ncbi:DHS-like NAD/FAD-binding domain-containing protein [Mycena venus]|uniref:DHS-like NAD/FAD-binding domain-containing protein n=1 Tax=Mycena venus TaxID=2733690 RepID=A0A8H7CA99_9AGAR|nr:DHS-like NAD/FAD-binding domain-containing protein [Mycena venus]